MAEVLLAETAGFCVGVKMAVDKTYAQLDQLEPGRNLATYGPIIHNKHVTGDLENRGVPILTDLEQTPDDTTVVIRSHGVPREAYETMAQKAIPYQDYTCPFVKKIHRIGEKEYNAGKKIIIVGDHVHPEIIGINSFSGGESIILKTMEEVEQLVLDENQAYAVVVQTTFQDKVFEEIAAAIKAKRHYANQVTVHNTICNATLERQSEADELSKKVDAMIVIGDPSSANSNKLYKICKENCENTHFVQSIQDLDLNYFQKSVRIGITAGASTPVAVIREAVSTMSELNNDEKSFEEMLNETMVPLHSGAVVKGTVLSVSPVEVSVNLNYKADGVISKDELSEDPTYDPTKEFKTGDEIEVFVVKINDGDGNVILSRKRIEDQKNKQLIEQAYENQDIVRGKVIDIVKGGLIALIFGVRIFVPASQMSGRFIQDLKQYKDQELDFKIIEFNRERNRMVAGRKELAMAEEAASREALISSFTVGSEVTGKVSRIVEFGLFVDLGGVDGLVHLSEISWDRKANHKKLFTEGDSVTVRIMKIDTEKQKISLSIKDIQGNPWLGIEERFPVGSLVDATVVRLVTFGAFAEIEPGIDGLIHISQISHKRVEKPEDALSLGDNVKVQIVEISQESRKISLSKKMADEALGLVSPAELAESETAATETESTSTEDPEATIETVTE